VPNGLRLYQSIVDQALRDRIDFKEACATCGMDAEVLKSCFNEPSTSPPHDLYEVLTRVVITHIAAYLKCSGFRVFLLADVFRWSDYQLLNNALNGGGQADQAHFIDAVVGSNIFGEPEFVIEQFISGTYSTVLSEACRKTNLDYRTLLSWKEGQSQAELAMLPAIREICAASELGLPIVMGCLGLLQKTDFLIDGKPVDIEAELAVVVETELR